MKNESTIEGSPSCIQITKGTESHLIGNYLDELNRCVEQLDLIGFIKLKEKFPFAKEVGRDPFYLELEENIRDNIAHGKKSLTKTDGFCHNCLMNKPVKIFGEGYAKIGLYYHFESDSPVEIHYCSFCFDYKDENQQETEEEHHTRFFSSKERHPKMVELAINFGESLKNYSMEKSFEILRDDVVYKQEYSQEIFHGNNDVLAAIKTVEEDLSSKGYLLRPTIAFYGHNDTNHEDIHSYDGIPCVLLKLNDLFMLWVLISSDKTIYDISSYLFTREELEELGVVTETDYEI